jgi:hypothetical protein
MAGVVFQTGIAVCVGVAGLAVALRGHNTMRYGLLFGALLAGIVAVVAGMSFRYYPSASEPSDVTLKKKRQQTLRAVHALTGTVLLLFIVAAFTF